MLRWGNLSHGAAVQCAVEKADFYSLKLIVEETRAVLKMTPGGVAAILRVMEVTNQYLDLVQNEFIRKIRERFFREGIADPFSVTPVRIEQLTILDLPKGAPPIRRL